MSFQGTPKKHASADLDRLVARVTELEAQAARVPALEAALATALEQWRLNAEIAQGLDLPQEAGIEAALWRACRRTVPGELPAPWQHPPEEAPP